MVDIGVASIAGFAGGAAAALLGMALGQSPFITDPNFLMIGGIMAFGGFSNLLITQELVN